MGKQTNIVSLHFSNELIDIKYSTDDIKATDCEIKVQDVTCNTWASNSVSNLNVIQINKQYENWKPKVTLKIPMLNAI